MSREANPEAQRQRGNGDAPAVLLQAGRLAEPAGYRAGARARKRADVVRRPVERKIIEAPEPDAKLDAI